VETIFFCCMYNIVTYVMLQFFVYEVVRDIVHVGFVLMSGLWVKLEPFLELFFGLVFIE